MRASVTPERLAEIRAHAEACQLRFHGNDVKELLTEIDALTQEVVMAKDYAAALRVANETCYDRSQEDRADLVKCEAENARLAAELENIRSYESWKRLTVERERLAAELQTMTNTARINLGGAKGFKTDADKLAADVAKLRKLIEYAYEHFAGKSSAWMRDAERVLAETAP